MSIIQLKEDGIEVFFVKSFKTLSIFFQVGKDWFYLAGCTNEGTSSFQELRVSLQHLSTYQRAERRF